MTKPVLPENALLTGRKIAALLIFLLLSCGCGKPPMLVQKYLLDYPAPRLRAAPWSTS